MLSQWTIIVSVLMTIMFGPGVRCEVKEVPSEPGSSFDFNDVDADGNGCVEGDREMQQFRLFVGKILGEALHLGNVERALRAGRITHSADVNGDGRICECDLLSILLTESTGPGLHRHAFRVYEDGSFFDDVDADDDGFLDDVTEMEALTQKLAKCVSEVKARTIVDAMAKLQDDDGKLARDEYLLFLKSPHQMAPAAPQSQPQAQDHPQPQPQSGPQASPQPAASASVQTPPQSQQVLSENKILAGAGEQKPNPQRFELSGRPRKRLPLPLERFPAVPGQPFQLQNQPGLPPFSVESHSPKQPLNVNKDRIAANSLPDQESRGQPAHVLHPAFRSLQPPRPAPQENNPQSLTKPNAPDVKNPSIQPHTSDDDSDDLTNQLAEVREESENEAVETKSQPEEEKAAMGEASEQEKPAAPAHA